MGNDVGDGVAGNDCDLLIVGGGINGAGIARDAAGRGYKVVLLEQSDLASATSSASTKLIHGGLRYLEQFEFRLVRESLIERERLLAIAPHIIHPMRFVLPHVAGLRPRWQIRAGLFIYDHLGGRRHLPASQGVKITGSEYGKALNDSISHGFMYSDCWVDDSRLVVLNAMDAAQRGASILPRTRFIAATVRDGMWQAQIEDRRSGTTSIIAARAIVNAAGPWVEAILQRFTGVSEHTQVRLVKGSHIVVPRLYPGEHAFLLQNPDGRVVFTLPYEGQYTLIGTTDVPFATDPASVTITDQEIAYLCTTVNSYFRQRITPAEVRWTYAGVRALKDDAATSDSKVTRDYTLELAEGAGAPALLSVFGGKITTYRRLAEMALQKLQPFIGAAHPQRAGQTWTDQAPLPGGDLPHGDFDAFLQSVQRRWPFLSAALAQRLARSYGTRIGDIIRTSRCMQDLGEHFGAGLTQAELAYLQTHEWAQSAEDVLWRRTKLGLHMSADERAHLERHLARDQPLSMPESSSATLQH